MSAQVLRITNVVKTKYMLKTGDPKTIRLSASVRSAVSATR
jgi:hypothetical protein